MRKIMFNDTYGLTRLVLDGIKIQTRRPYNSNETKPYKVSETVAIAQSYRNIAKNNTLDNSTRRYIYIWAYSAGWKNKMFVKADLMPYRIIILDRWVECIQDITPEDCLNEGITRGVLGYTFPNHPFHYETPYDAYEQLMKLLYGKKYWDANPLVQAYKFKLIKDGNN